MSYDKNKLVAELKRDEGFRANCYQDSEGYWTIGIGRLCDDRFSRGLSEDEAEYMLANDIEECEKEVRSTFPWFNNLNDVRQRAIINMCFNLGLTRLLQFKKFLAAMEAEDYETAGVEMLDSRWAKQVGERSQRLEKMIVEGS
tara:strand:- start:573 stop:1001 length:429 start_codon:yes stop_codon:yes gene_type:complete